MARRVEFTVADGSRVELECDERFEALVRDKCGLMNGEEVTDEHVRWVFTEALRRAAEG